MIPLTPKIMGPGIEEEYADAMERIEKLEVLLKPFAPANDTREGRMVYQLQWLRQEITAKRLPIPLDRKYWGTLAYLVGEGSLDYLGGEVFMGELTRILDGTGLLKKRHYPVVVAMIDDFLAYLQPHSTGLDSIEEKLIQESREIRRGIIGGSMILPLDENAFPGWKQVVRTDTKHLDAIPDFGNRSYSVYLPIFGGYRPKPCRKGTLPAPNPGMVWGGDKGTVP